MCLIWFKAKLIFLGIVSVLKRIISNSLFARFATPIKLNVKMIILTHQ